MKNLLVSFPHGSRSAAPQNLMTAIGSTVARQLLASALYFVGLWITTRALGPENNGLLATLMLLPQTLFAFLNLGLGPSHVYHLSSGLGNYRTMQKSNWVLALAMWLIVVAVIALCPAPAIAKFLPGIDKASALWASVLFPLMLLAAWSSALIQGSRDYRGYNLTLLVQPMVFFTAIVLLRATSMLSPLSVVCASIASQACLWLLSELHISRFDDPPPARSAKLFATMRFGLRAHLSNMITYLNYRLALYLVSFLLGTTAVGSYALSVQLAEVFWLVSGAAAMIIFPESASRGRTPRELQQLVERVAFWVVLVTGAGAVVAGLLAPLAIPWVFGKAFEGSVLPFIILLPGVVLWSYMSVIANSIAGMGFQGVNIRGALLCLAINVVGDYFLIPRWGTAGAATSSALAFICTAIYTVLVYKSIMRRSVLAGSL